MKYRILGKTGFSVSEIGLGCEGFMDKSQEEVSKLIDEAKKQGINFIDLYSPNPDMRTHVGEAIKNNREDWILQAHLSTVFKNDQYLRTRKMDEVIEGFDDLLSRMQTDYIDVGMIHYVDAKKDLDEVLNGEVLSYAKKLKEEGKIKSIGLSSHNPVVALEAVQTGLIDVLLFSINPCYDMQPATENVEDLWDDDNYVNPLTNIDPDRDALYKYCEKENIAITVMKAFGGGDLLDEKLSPFGVKMTVPQCLHYCLTRPGVVSVMSGVHTKEELLLNTSYYTVDETKRDFAEVLSNVPKHSFVGNCVYCGHCAPCAMKIDIANVHKFLDLCIAQNQVPETVQQHYDSLEHHASECIECGQCMNNCPFQVDIISKMKKAVEVFGH